MANRKKKNNNNAIGGALTPAMPSAPRPAAPATFNQFVAAPPAAHGTPTRGVAPVAANPFTAPASTAVADPAPHGTPGRGTLPNGTTPPLPSAVPDPTANPVGMYDPVLYAAFMRHKFWMDNAKNRGDDPANYGAGGMRTMAF